MEKTELYIKKISFISVITILILNSACFAQIKNESSDLNWFNRLELYNKSENRGYYLKLKSNDSTITDVIGKTNECDVFLKDRSSLKNVSLVKLSGNSLFVVKDGIRKKIEAQDINKIRFPGSSGFWTGAVVGTGASLAAWTFVIIAFRGEFTPNIIAYELLFSLPAGLVGGLIGLIFSTNDEVYDISGGNPNARLKRLKYIIEKHHTPAIQ
jgi:hypothetical protein